MASFVAVGCGTDSGGGGGGADDPEGEVVDGDVDFDGDKSDAPLTLAVADDDAKPPCADVNESQLVYVISKKAFQVCHDKKWAAIEIAGKDGKDGENGEAGADGEAGEAGVAGADGEDGTDNRIVATVFCNGQVGTSAYDISYAVQQMSSGDVFVSGSIDNSQIQVSGSNFYSSQQVGAATAPVTMTFDAVATDNYGWWKLFLDRSTLITTIEYHDAENAGGEPMVWTMAPEDCTVNDYN